MGGGETRVDGGREGERGCFDGCVSGIVREQVCVCVCVCVCVVAERETDRAAACV